MSDANVGWRYGDVENNHAVPSAPSLNNQDTLHHDPPPSYAEAMAAAGRSVPLEGGSGTGHSPAPAHSGSGNADDSQPQPASGAGSRGDAPPSYQSLFGQIKEARETSSSVCDFLTKIFLMPLGFLVALVIFIGCVCLLFGLPVTLLAVGSYYMYDCPVQPAIPIWMVVGGLMMLLHAVQSKGKDSACFDGLMTLCYLVWYITGAGIIYPHCWPAYEPGGSEDPLHCGFTLYMTAFVVINILSVLVALLCCVVVTS